MTDHTVSNSNVWLIDAPIYGVEFHPKPDITAYELALLLPYFTGRPIFQRDLDAMSEELKRHLKIPQK